MSSPLIPAGWREIKLSECLTVKHGKNQKEVESRDGTYPILGTGGEIGRTNSYLYNKPSVLIGRKGTIDKPRYMDTPFWTVDTLFYTDIKVSAIPKYVFYVFNTINWYKYNEASGVPSLSASTISSIKINLPSKSEQSQIVEILETWDIYLGKLDEKIALKKSINVALARQLLTGVVRIMGFYGAWVQHKLGDVANIEKGKALTSNGLLHGEIPVIAGGKTSPYNHNSYTHEDVITVSASGAYAGYVAHHSYKIWASDCSVIYGKKGLSTTDYIYQFLRKIQESIYLLQSGGAQPHVYPADLKTMKIALPAIDEQDAISKVLSLADKELTLLEKNRILLRTQRNYLVNKLVTGDIRSPESFVEHVKEASNA